MTPCTRADSELAFIQTNDRICITFANTYFVIYIWIVELLIQTIFCHHNDSPSIAISNAFNVNLFECCEFSNQPNKYDQRWMRRRRRSGRRRRRPKYTTSCKRIKWNANFVDWLLVVWCETKSEYVTFMFNTEIRVNSFSKFLSRNAKVALNCWMLHDCIIFIIILFLVFLLFLSASCCLGFFMRILSVYSISEFVVLVLMERSKCTQ